MGSPQADEQRFEVPKGWLLVPIIATPEMDAAGKKALSDNGVDDVDDTDALVTYRAMTSAAPEFTCSTQHSASAPKWSHTPPTKDGWYWLKEGHEAGMARVEGDCFWQYGEIFDVADVDGGLWCGPLQEPTE